jgi:hypothetical protein
VAFVHPISDESPSTVISPLYILNRVAVESFGVVTAFITKFIVMKTKISKSNFFILVEFS